MGVKALAAGDVRAVFLVGFMGCGKNTVGQELAQRLGWNFLDLDAYIEAREGQSVPEIFKLRGESGFRSAETSALDDLLTTGLGMPTIVALGGGAFVQAKNRELLRLFRSVFLDTPVQELWRRCLQDHVERPLRKDPKQFAYLHAERLPSYRQASLVVQTHGKELGLICQEIEYGLQLKRTNSEGPSAATRGSEKGESQ